MEVVRLVGIGCIVRGCGIVEGGKVLLKGKRPREARVETLPLGQLRGGASRRHPSVELVGGAVV